MPQKFGITSLVAAHYPSKTPDGRTIVHSEPPGIAVLKEDGTVVLRRDDELARSHSSLEEFMASPPPKTPPSTCIICGKEITMEQPSNGPVPHGEGMAHESCHDRFTDKLLETYPPRGHRPRPRGPR